MWYKLGKFILRYRISLLILLFSATVVMGYFASKVQLSYDFGRAVPVDNPKFVEFEAFKKKFGESGGVLVIGLQTKDFYTPKVFNPLISLAANLKKIKGVDNVLTISETVQLVKNDSTNKLIPTPIFLKENNTQQQLDSSRRIFENQPFYRDLLYRPSLTPDSNAYIVGVNVNKDLINTKYRTTLVADIMHEVTAFEKATDIHVHTSGMPFIRTTVSDLIKSEMKWFLIGSLLLSALSLLLFFRSGSTMIMSLMVVMMGVIWSLGTVALCGYKITLLTALIPPLIVVIGIPNCIYFLNKYHSAYKENR